jgi:uncharacterized Zn finger protein
MNIYLVFCKNCKSKTRHTERMLNKLRGVKVVCCECGNLRNQYIKFDCLQKLKVEHTGVMGSNAGAPSNLNLNREVQNGKT